MASKNDKLETSLKSITTKLFQTGFGKSPGDLISSILDDHEQSKANRDREAVVVLSVGGEGIKNISPVDDQTARNERELLSQVQRRRSESDILQKSHWDNAAQASKCADCRKRFTSILDRRRNCHMCGKVFCRHCTNYQKKLSVIAEPDPLGKFYNVCHKCFDHTTIAGVEKDLMRDFSSFRREIKDRKTKQIEDEMQKPLSSRRSSDSKREAYTEETKRLIEGFSTNSGWVKGFMAEMSVPVWQKAALWTPSSKASDCFGCKTAFKFGNRKIHCRVCGQVFCTSCTTDEIILYATESGMIRWAVNGKPGGPTTKPEQYENLPICGDCSTELQALMMSSFEPRTPERRDFSDKIFAIHKKLSQLLELVETWLPEYQMIADSLDVIDGCPNSVQGRHPMRDLIKSQSNLSDAFTQLAIESQKLKAIKPQSEIQDQLLRHVMIGTYQFYSDNMYVFRNTKNRLKELMPLEHLEQIQLILSQQSMERVHLVVQQMMYEAMTLEQHYKFDSSFFGHLVDVVRNIELEFKPFLKEREESWDRHVDCLKTFLREELAKDRKKIKVDKSLTRAYPERMRYVVISQCSSLVHECYRDLQAKTIDREFQKTKASLNKACKLLDEILVGFNQAF